MKLDLLKELGRRLKSKKLIWMVLGMLATSIGMLGGFPQPPKIFLQFVEDYPILQWALVFVLIYQGMGGGDMYWSAIGVGATFLLYKVMDYVTENFENDGEQKEKEESAGFLASIIAFFTNLFGSKAE